MVETFQGGHGKIAAAQIETLRADAQAREAARYNAERNTAIQERDDARRERDEARAQLLGVSTPLAAQEEVTAFRDRILELEEQVAEARG